MGSFYRLQIQCDLQKKKEVDTILGESNDDPDIGWGLIIEEDSPMFNQALNLFVELIDKNLSKLKKIGVSVHKITFGTCMNTNNNVIWSSALISLKELVNWEWYCVLVAGKNFFETLWFPGTVTFRAYNGSPPSAGINFTAIR